MTALDLFYKLLKRADKLYAKYQANKYEAFLMRDHGAAKDDPTGLRYVEKMRLYRDMLRGAMPRANGEYYGTLLINNKLTQVIEFGTGLGISTLWLYCALRALSNALATPSTLVTVDGCANCLAIAKKELVAFGESITDVGDFCTLHFVHGSFVSSSELAFANLPAPQAAVIAGGYKPAVLAHNIEQSKQRIKSGLIIVDNATFNKQVTDVCNSSFARASWLNNSCIEYV